MKGITGLLILGLINCHARDSGEAPWYSNAIIYQIYPKSFQDSNGDGIGDLKGIIQRVDYLEHLGVDAIWLNPIYPSPNKDLGYDISNYKDIHPLYGSLKDFKQLVTVLKSKGIKVMLDFVLNHSSKEHPWFAKSLNQEPQYKNYYIWNEGKLDLKGKSGPVNNWTAMYGGSMWAYNHRRREFYLHQYMKEEPDLNYRNPEVVKEMNDVLKFWMDMGVDGFKMDAVASLIENSTLGNEPLIGPESNNHQDYNHTMTLNQPETFDVMQNFMGTIDNYAKGVDHVPKLVITENCNMNYEMILNYYGTQARPRSTFPLNMFFIRFMNRGSNAAEWANTVNEWYRLAMPKGNWAIANWMLGNHDLRRVASRFSPEHSDVLNMLQLSLKGVSIVYYGDELGLQDTLVLRRHSESSQSSIKHIKFHRKNMINSRAPMPWNNSTNGNFTTGRPWLPLASDYWENNVEAQIASERSHLNIFRKMAALKKTKTMMSGDCNITYQGSTLIIYRSLIDCPTIITVLNMGRFENTVNLSRIRPNLPTRLKILVASENYPLPDKSTLSNASVSPDGLVLPPISAIVLSSACNNF